MIRIISGIHRGRRIKAPRNLPVRPTTDRAKEALFNILHNRYDFSELKCLDLFCGTGNLSIELASRGCKDITAVDSNRNCISFVNSIANELNEESIQCIQSDALRFLFNSNKSYDLILADPPYDYDSYDELITTAMEGQLLSDYGVLIIEHDSRISLNEFTGFVERRSYGNSSFTFFGLPES